VLANCFRSFQLSPFQRNDLNGATTTAVFLVPELPKLGKKKKMIPTGKRQLARTPVMPKGQKLGSGQRKPLTMVNGENSSLYASNSPLAPDEEDLALLKDHQRTRKLEEIADVLLKWKERHKNAKRRLNEISFRKEMDVEVEKKSRDLQVQAETWLRENGILRTDANELTIEEIESGLQKANTMRKAVENEKNSLLAELKDNSELSNDNEKQKRLEDIRAQEALHEQRISMQEGILDEIRMKMRTAEFSITTPRTLISDVDLQLLQSQRKQLENELRSLQNSTFDETEAKCLLVRVELFIERYETLRRTAKLIESFF